MAPGGSGGFRFAATSAVALIAGGLLFGLTDAQHLTLGHDPSTSEGGATAEYLVHHLLELPGLVLLLLGFPALYVLRSERYGWSGFAAFVWLFAGLALILGAWFYLTFAVPSLAIGAPAFLDTDPEPGPLRPALLASFWAFSGGAALFGLVTLWTRAWPWPGPALLIAGGLTYPPLQLFGHLPTGPRLVLCLGFVQLGIHLWRARRQPDATGA